jgi:thiamine biosynthesis lipoprotein
MHHIVDPRTGLPAPVVWRTVSATGPTCVAANAATTAAIVLGAGAAQWLRRHGFPARLVARDGRVLHLGGWPEGDDDAAPVGGAPSNLTE